MKTVFLFGDSAFPKRAWYGVYEGLRSMAAALGGGELCFLVGQKRGFNACAMGLLPVLRSEYPLIKLLQLASCENPPKRYLMFTEFDGICCPEGAKTVSEEYGMIKASKTMVDTCDAVVCYARREGSLTHKLMRRAQRRGIPVVNLAEKTMEEMESIYLTNALKQKNSEKNT